MAAGVDEKRRVVVVGDTEWPFRLDLRRGVAILGAGAGERRVRAQRWIEKRRLAQFASWGEEFLREQVWLMCVRPAGPAFREEEGAAALELAWWLSSGGRLSEALPLDRALLARVTLDSCQALGVATTALDDLPAYEVELLWRTSLPSASFPAGSPVETNRRHFAPHEEFTHRIVIVPDPKRAAAEEPVGDLEARTKEESFPSAEPRRAAPAGAFQSAPVAEPANPAPSGVAVSPFSEEDPGVPPPHLAGRKRFAESQCCPPEKELPAEAARREPSPAVPHPLSNAAWRQRLAARFRVVTRSVPLPPAIPGTESDRPLQVPSLAASSSEPVVSRRLEPPAFPSPGPFVPPAFAPQQPAAASLFDDFADEFAERLESAAAELGILGGR
jgi:hypothetical protein